MWRKVSRLVKTFGKFRFSYSAVLVWAQLFRRRETHDTLSRLWPSPGSSRERHYNCHLLLLLLLLVYRSDRWSSRWFSPRLKRTQRTSEMHGGRDRNVLWLPRL